MTAIRPANQHDIPWLLAQLQTFAEFLGSAVALFPRDPAVARAILAPLVTMQPFFVAELPDGMRVGFIAGALAPHPFNPVVRTLSEIFWWVSPDYRGTTAGARLLEHFVGYGRLHADLVVMTLETKSPIDDRVLLKRGFVERERSFVLEVNHETAVPAFRSEEVFSA